MKKKFLLLTVAVAIVSMNAAPTFAIKGFNKQWLETYTETPEEVDEDFKELATSVKCNLCHVKGEKKSVKNTYGEALSDFLRKKDFPSKRFKEEPEVVKEEIEAAFEKVAEMEYEEGVTFGERIAEGKLPGGDVEKKDDDK